MCICIYIYMYIYIYIYIYNILPVVLLLVWGVHLQLLCRRFELSEIWCSSIWSPGSIWWSVQSTNFLLLFSLFCSDFLCLWPKHLSQTPSIMFVSIRNLVWHPYKTADKNCSSEFLIFLLLGRKWQDKRFWNEWQQAVPDCNVAGCPWLQCRRLSLIAMWQAVPDCYVVGCPWLQCYLHFWAMQFWFVSVIRKCFNFSTFNRLWAAICSAFCFKT